MRKFPFEFDETFFNNIENAVADGATSTKEIAEAIGIKYNTFKSWRYKKFTEKDKEIACRIEDAIKKGINRRAINIRKTAENALIKSITGYFVEEETTEIKKDSAGREYTHNKKVKKYIPPSVTAQIFALVNVSDKWHSINNANVKDLQSDNNIVFELADESTIKKAKELIDKELKRRNENKDNKDI